MTALDRYVRLEATGLWRESREAPPREVIVSFGNATLTLKDLADAPLGHWALAGVAALRREGTATVYSMTADGAETLEIGDPAMTAAIAAVTRADLLPRRRRRRFPFAPLLLLAALGAAAWAARDVLRPDPSLLVPPARAAEIGDRMLVTLVEQHGRPCSGAAGTAALARLAERLAPTAPPRLLIMPLGGVPSAALPGGTILLDASLATGPAEALAGWAALALARNPPRALLAGAGPVAGARYLLSGAFDDAAIAHAAEAALVPPSAAEAGPALARLAAAGIDPRPFAAALAAVGLPVDLPPDGGAPALSDRDRAALGALCAPG